MVLRLASAALLLALGAAECTPKKLRALLRRQRGHAWACEGRAEGVEALDSVPWADLVFDNAEAFRTLSYKVMDPLPMPEALDALWSSRAAFTQESRVPEAGGASARSWISANVGPGMAVAIESMNRLPELDEARRGLMEQLGVSGGIDLYAARLPPHDGRAAEGAPLVGSYGWHLDTVDAFIYILAGTKRVRVAGYAPGSRVTLDRVLGPRSAVYVPGGRWHHLLAFQSQGDGAEAGGWPGAWVRVLSIGLPNPNDDHLERRMHGFSDALKDRGLTWPSGPSAPALQLPEWLVGKPETRFSEVDALDSHGLAALHRRTLRGELDWIRVLVLQGASVDLATRADDKRPSLTALGLALCCAPPVLAAKTAELLLSLGASTAEVEFRRGRPLSARKVALRRGSFPKSLLAQLPAGGGGEL